MASINLSGILLNPQGVADGGAVLKFTLLTTTGSTISSSKSQFRVPKNGAYDIDIVYGNLRIDYTNKYGSSKFIAIVTVNSDTTATSLPELLSAATPITPATILQPQAASTGTTYPKANMGIGSHDHVTYTYGQGGGTADNNIIRLDYYTGGASGTLVGTVELGYNSSNLPVSKERTA